MDGCTDMYEDPKPPWRLRKEAYLARLQAASPSVIRVSLADKLHNARAMLLDCRSLGDRLFGRFRAGKADQLWSYGALLAVFTPLSTSPMVGELERTVTELLRVTSSPDSRGKRLTVSP